MKCSPIWAGGCLICIITMSGFCNLIDGSSESYVTFKNTFIFSLSCHSWKWLIVDLNSSHYALGLQDTCVKWCRLNIQFLVKKTDIKKWMVLSQLQQLLFSFPFVCFLWEIPPRFDLLSVFKSGAALRVFWEHFQWICTT